MEHTVETPRPRVENHQMKVKLLFLCLLVGLIFSASAQQAQPQPKSQEELDALMAIQSAASADQRVMLATKFLKDYPKTEFKEFGNYMLMLSYQQLNDFENMLLFGERTLEENPDNVGTLLQLAFAIPNRTREFDLDKDEKLARAEDYAKRALTLVPNMEKPNPNVPDEEWLTSKRDFMSQGNESIGLVAMKRADYPVAEEMLRKALTLAVKQSGSTMYYLADALHQQGKKDEALGMIDQSIAAGGVPLGEGSNLADALKKEIQAGG